MLTDGHNHTKRFSSDAKMSAYELIDIARKSGSNGIAITEHYEGDYPHDIPEPQIFDLMQYQTEFVKWKNHAMSLPLRMGIELGYQPHLVKKYDEMISAYPFDTVILSNHLFDGNDPYFVKDCYQLPKIDLHRQYIDSLAEMVEASYNFNVLGHYDYIVRYNKSPNPEMTYEDCPKSFDRLFEALIAKNKSLEINTRTISKLKMKGCVNCFPDKVILERYFAMGGRLISLGSDSHDIDTLGDHFKAVADYLITFGFTENSYYVNRQRQSESLFDA